jgi:hypothetical protein
VPRALTGRLLALATIALALACSRADERARAPVRALEAPRAAAFDPARPIEALHAAADEAAARVGSFAWQAEVTWSVARPGTAPIAASERHRLRQLRSGEFELATDLDPGTGPASLQGKQIVFARGRTYARGRWAPWRERPTDRGNGARRYRDDSFRLAADLADLYGPALAATAAGEATVLGRPALRYRLSLSSDAPGAHPAAAGAPDGGPDADTKKRLDFLDGRVPTALAGELLLDAATGLPLSVSMKGAFSERADPQLRAEVALDAQVTALGDVVPAIVPPKDALADDRKPKGVARALEAAGLRKRGARADQEEPADEGEPSSGE